MWTLPSCARRVIRARSLLAPESWREYPARTSLVSLLHTAVVLRHARATLTYVSLFFLNQEPTKIVVNQFWSLPTHVDVAAFLQQIPDLLLAVLHHVLDVDLLLGLPGERHVDLGQRPVLLVLLNLLLVDEVLRPLPAAEEEDRLPDLLGCKEKQVESEKLVSKGPWDSKRSPLSATTGQSRGWTPQPSWLQREINRKWKINIKRSLG